jgi:glycosyltransferase involved in cell wall biosynthesis
MLNNLTLIIPAKEEKHSLPRVLNEIKDLGLKKLIILSKDDYETRNAIKNFDCEILFQNGNGYGNAIREGINHASTKYIAIFYADGSTDPKNLKPMLDKIILDKNQIIFGSRYEKNAGSYDDDLITRIGNYFFTLFGNIFFSLSISDILFTYIVSEKSAMDKLELISDDYCLCVEIPLKSKELGFKYTTHPCIERKRFADKKKVKAFNDGIKILHYMFKMLLSNILRKKY